MNQFVKFGVVAATIGMSSVLLAADATGKWNGKVKMQVPAMPASATAQQKAQMAKAMEAISKTKISLVLKANHTYIVDTTNPMTNKPENSTGKWSQSGNNVTLTSDKGQQSKTPQTFTLSKDGKTMTLQIPANSPVKGSVIFTKA